MRSLFHCVEFAFECCRMLECVCLDWHVSQLGFSTQMCILTFLCCMYVCGKHTNLLMNILRSHLHLLYSNLHPTVFLVQQSAEVATTLDLTIFSLVGVCFLYSFLPTSGMSLVLTVGYEMSLLGHLYANYGQHRQCCRTAQSGAPWRWTNPRFRWLKSSHMPWCYWMCRADSVISVKQTNINTHINIYVYTYGAGSLTDTFCNF